MRTVTYLGTANQPDKFNDFDKRAIAHAVDRMIYFNMGIRDFFVKIVGMQIRISGMIDDKEVLVGKVQYMLQKVTIYDGDNKIYEIEFNKI